MYILITIKYLSPQLFCVLLNNNSAHNNNNNKYTFKKQYGNEFNLSARMKNVFKTLRPAFQDTSNVIIIKYKNVQVELYGLARPRGPL